VTRRLNAARCTSHQGVAGSVARTDSNTTGNPEVERAESRSGLLNLKVWSAEFLD
jgi:hypothetical protein